MFTYVNSTQFKIIILKEIETNNNTIYINILPLLFYKKYFSLHLENRQQ